METQDKYTLEDYLMANRQITGKEQEMKKIESLAGTMKAIIDKMENKKENNSNHP